MGSGRKPIFAIILAGGSGERFWPLSSPKRPKQFLKIFGGKSLIRQAMERVLPVVPVANIIVITAKTLAAATRAELPELPRENVILEPCRKNTASAIATALGEVLRRGGEDALAITLTADQLMKKPGVFRSLLVKSLGVAARKDVIVTLGVKPTYPATGFGYIDRERKIFVEKPDATTAARSLKSGKYLWNAGMFIFRAGALAAILEGTFGEPGFTAAVSNADFSLVRLCRDGAHAGHRSCQWRFRLGRCRRLRGTGRAFAGRRAGQHSLGQNPSARMHWLHAARRRGSRLGLRS